MKNPYNEYKKTGINTASKESILIMLYEGAIKFLKQAAVAMDEKNIEKKGKLIIKAEEIINELLCVLDHEKGWEISKDLEGLYMFMLRKCSEANLNNSKQDLEVVIKLLETLLSGWRDAIKKLQTKG